jgi:hypothetical protein
MENQELLGIILPVYNPPIDLLEKCIVSIVNNKWQNFEVIITVDYYSDLIINILDKISKEDKRFKLFINKNNEGSYYNYFHTIKNASKECKYFTILDCDDTIDEFFYYDLITQLKKENAEINLCNMKIYNYITKESSWHQNTVDKIPLNDARIVKSIFTSDLLYRCWDKLSQMDTFIFYGTDNIIAEILSSESKKTIRQITNSAYNYTNFNDNQTVNALKKDVNYLSLRLLSSIKSMNLIPSQKDFFLWDIDYIKNSYNYNSVISNNEKQRLINFINKYSKIAYSNNTIPPIIHYIWLGNEIPYQNKQLLKTWEEKNPNFLIIKWDDSYFKNNSFVQSCIKTKKYAFAADYIRAWILYNFGGIYLDTDVECIKPFSDELLNQEYLFGYENDNQIIQCGVIGCNIKNIYIKKLFDWFNTLSDISDLEKIKPIYTICNIFTQIIKNDNLKIYSNEYFIADHYNPLMKKQYQITDKTITHHHYELGGSWLKDKEFKISDFGFK